MATRNHAEQIYYGAQCGIRNFLGFGSRDYRIKRIFIIELAVTIHTDCIKEEHEDKLGCDFTFSDGSSLRVNRDSSCAFNVAPPPEDFDKQLKRETIDSQRRKAVFVARKIDEKYKGVKRK